MSPITVQVAGMSDEEKRRRVRLLLGYLIVELDPQRRACDPLAKKIGVSRQYLNTCIERGRCSMSVARQLQKIFGKEKAPADQLCWSQIS